MRPFVLACLIPPLLAACGPLPYSVPVLSETGGSWPHVRMALQAGPLPVRVIGPAYPGASDAETLALVSKAIEGAITWYPTTTRDAQTLEDPLAKRVVWVMDAPDGMDPDLPCTPMVASTLAGPADPTQLSALVAFCSGTVATSAVQGVVDRSPEDPALAPERLVRQMVRQLADQGKTEDDKEVIWVTQ
jgi:hypothetical protein